VSEALRVNSTLTSLRLSGDTNGRKKKASVVGDVALAFQQVAK